MQEICYALTFEKSYDMNKKFASVFSVLILVVFIGYIIFDTSRPAGIEKKAETRTSDLTPCLKNGRFQVNCMSLKDHLKLSQFHLQEISIWEEIHLFHAIQSDLTQALEY